MEVSTSANSCKKQLIPVDHAVVEDMHHSESLATYMDIVKFSLLLGSNKVLSNFEASVVKCPRSALLCNSELYFYFT